MKCCNLGSIGGVFLVSLPQLCLQHQCLISQFQLQFLPVILLLQKSWLLTYIREFHVISKFNFSALCIFLQVMKSCSKLSKIFLTAMVHELYKTGMGEITIEKVNFSSSKNFYYLANFIYIVTLVPRTKNQWNTWRCSSFINSWAFLSYVFFLYVLILLRGGLGFGG